MKVDARSKLVCKNVDITGGEVQYSDHVKRYIGLSVDLEAQAAYVRYRPLPAGERARSKRVSEDVAVDYREDGELLGVELLALDDAAMAQAKAFAIANGLAFPRDLSGALLPA